MRIVAVGRAIYRMLLPQEQRHARHLVTLSLATAAFEAVGATLVLGLLARFTTNDGSSFIDKFLPAWDSRDVTILLGVLTLVFAFLRLTVSLVETHLRARRIQQMAGSLSSRILERYSRMPLVAHAEHRSGDFLRNTWFASEMMIRQAFTGVLVACTELALMVGTLSVLVVAAPSAAFGVAGLVTLLLIVGYRVLSRYITVWGADAEDHAAACLQQVQEFFGGFREIKLAGAEEYFVGRYRVRRMDLARSYWRFFTINQVPRLVFEGLLAVAVATLVMVFTLSASEQDGITTMALFGYAGFRILPSANRVLAAVGDAAYGSPALEIVAPVFDGPVEDCGDPATVVPFEHEIVVSGVAVRYPGSNVPAIEGVALTVARGERIGIVGGSGAGKTTLLNVLIGLIQPDAGIVRVDGQDISDLLSSWRRQVGLVGQNAFLVDDSIRSNVAFGVASHLVDDQRIWQSLEIAQLADHVRSLPDGLGERIGDRGTRLSGGQVQRLAIARAIYGQPRILALDEPTAALDGETEAALAESLMEISSGFTTILVSHRLRVLRLCDRIYRVRGGCLEVVGAYEDLLADSGWGDGAA